MKSGLRHRSQRWVGSDDLRRASPFVVYLVRQLIKRYQYINNVLKAGQTIDASKAKDLRSKLDRVLTHKFWGYVIFFFILSDIFFEIK